MNETGPGRTAAATGADSTSPGGLPPTGGRARRASRLRPVLATVLALIGLAALGNWLYGRLTHVVVYDARIEADVITVSSRVNGWVTGLPVEAGASIARGDSLVTLDARQPTLRLNELDSELAMMANDRQRLLAEIAMTDRQTQSRLQAAQAELSAAEAALAAQQSETEQASSDFERAQSLLDRLAVSRQRWEALRTAHQKAQHDVLRTGADVAKAQAAVLEAEAGRQQLDVLRRRLASLRHDEERLHAQRERQRLDVEDRTLRSPINGVVDRIFVDVGEYIAPGQRLMLIHDPQAIWVEANVKETDIRQIAIGGTAKVRVDAYPDLALTGRIVRIGSTATSKFALLPNPSPSGNFTKITQRLPVKIAIEQVDGALRPGMMVEVDIAIARD